MIVVMVLAHETFSFPNPEEIVNIIKLKFVPFSCKKILLLDLRGRRDELAVLNSLGRNQFAGNLVHLVAAAADDNDFQAVMFIEVNVQAGIHGHMSLMLHLRQEIAQVMDPVVINEGDDADNFGIRLPDLLLNQVVPDQVADRFRAVLIALTADASIESVQQILLQRDPKSG
jgi:hypothetical protein